MSQARLAGAVALVTGSSRGIGLGIAQRLAADGASVVLNGLDAGELAEAAERVEHGATAVDAVVADVGEVGEVERLFRHVITRHGRIDVLVNNAALANPVAHFLEMDPSHWSEVLRCNLTSVFLCTRFAAEEMARARRGGTVINISSFGALRAHRRLAAYDTAKGGVEAFTRAVALDLAPFAIRVNAVAPGPIGTAATTADDADASRRAALVPLGRLGAPRDVADAVSFLACDEARFITGQTLIVDGGVVAQGRPPQLDAPGMTFDELEARPRLLQLGEARP
jgi:NAD(P)-dependent dehydrogenase (short-subunit alcohol dehydrogenase family)